MRKMLLLIFALTLTFLLTSCTMDQLMGEWKYDDTYHWKSILITTIKSAHVDSEESADGICDVCGYNMTKSHTEHTFNYVTEGETGHYKNYTCGCPSEEGTMPHYDENGDKLCDACEYTLEDSTLYFHSISDINNKIDINNIKKVILDYSNPSPVNPMNKVTEIINYDQIMSISNFIKNAKFTLNNDSYDGVGIYNVTLFDENGSFEFSLSQRYEYYIDGICYNSSLEFPINLKLLKTDYLYFDSNSDVQLSSYGNITNLEDFDISQIHLLNSDIIFLSYDYTKDADLIINGKTYRIINSTIICDENWMYYIVVGEKNFESLLPSDEDYIVAEIIDDIGRIARITLSYNVVYTYEEIEEIVIKFTQRTDFIILNRNRTKYVDRQILPEDILIIEYTS